MSLGRFLLGLAGLALVVVPLAAGAMALRRRLVPAWWGAPTRLADAVLTLSLLLVVAQVLGAVGLFRPLPLVAGALVVGSVAIRLGRGTPAAAREPAPPAAGRGPAAVAVGVTAVLAGQWATRVAAALGGGVTEYDSLHYQLPFAARFAADGWLTQLHFTKPEFPVHFHPATSEVFHATGMTMFGADVLAPLLNLGWLALALGAAWCIGRPRGLGPAAVVSVAVLLGTPLVSISQAGTAHTDLAGTACLLAAVALLLHARSPLDRRAVVVAGAAAGLAAGIKLTLLAPVAALTVAVVVLAGRGARRANAPAWLAPLAATGSYWYLRNLVRTGTPIAGIDVGVGPLSLPRPRFDLPDRLGFSVADYATDGEVWREWFLPGLSRALGRAWWAMLALVAVAGVVALVRRGSPPVLRALAVVVAASVAGYLVAPTTAMGEQGAPLLFVSNLRYAVPALAIGLGLLPLATGRVALPVALAVLVVTWTSRREPAWPGTHELAAVLAAVAVVVVAAALSTKVLGHRLVAAGLAVAAVAGGFAAQDRYLDGRYRDEPLARWADSVHDQRIAVAGFDVQYQLHGAHLSNFVQYVGERGPHGELHHVDSCDRWRRLLRDGRFDWVVLEEFHSPVDDQAAWTASDPATLETRRVGRATLYRLDPRAPVEPCGGPASSQAARKSGASRW